MADVITGLACPNCSGALSVREGQKIVKCPYCNARSQVSGERGVGRYQVARRIDRERASQAVRGFWSGLNRAFDLSSKAQISEPLVRGLCPPAFDMVRQAFADNFARGEELGARFTVTLDGEVVVDLMGGFADRARD